MNADRQYVGRGKVVGTFGNIRIGIRVTDLKPNEKGYVNLIVAEKREADEYGNTHSVYVDDWKPNQQRQDTAPASQPVGVTSGSPMYVPPPPPSDLPF